MGKRIQITPDIANRIFQLSGGPIDLSAIAAYQGVALTNRRIRQKFSIFDNAEITHRTFEDMVNYVKANQSVAVYLNHMRFAGLPIGKIFDASLREVDGVTELLTSFLIDKTEEKVVSKIDNALVNELSTGFSGEKLLCSECGFDFARGTEDNWFDGTCDKGHTIGDKDTHLIIDGLQDWQEVSLVHKGASPGTQILWQYQTHQKPQALAASARTFHPVFLVYSRSEETMPGATDQSTTLLTAEIVAAADTPEEGAPATPAAPATSTVITATTPAVATIDLAATLNELVTVRVDRDRLTAELAAARAESTTIRTELAAVRDEATAMDTFLRDLHTRYSVALGSQAVAAPTTRKDLVARLSAMQTQLRSMIPVGGLTNQAGARAREDQPATPLTAFRTR